MATMRETVDRTPPSVDEIIRFEGGGMDDQETIRFVARLVASGLAWKFQGCYGRLAARMIEAGIVSRDGRVLCDQKEGS